MYDPHRVVVLQYMTMKVFLPAAPSPREHARIVTCHSAELHSSICLPVIVARDRVWQTCVDSPVIVKA